jgi:hypothetical protein
MITRFSRGNLGGSLRNHRIKTTNSSDQKRAHMITHYESNAKDHIFIHHASAENKIRIRFHVKKKEQQLIWEKEKIE